MRVRIGAGGRRRRITRGSSTHGQVLPDRYSQAVLRRGIGSCRVHWFSRLRSTSDHAAVLRKRGKLFAPSIVLTAHQLAGRGRGDHVWWSGRGSLTATFAIPIDDRRAPHQLPLLAGLAVRNGLAPLAGGQQIQLKWPNDLLVDGRKLGGLLCQRINGVDLVGVGLNVNRVGRPPTKSLRDHIAFLSHDRSSPLDLTRVLVAVTEQLQATLLRSIHRPFAALLQEYDEHHALLGKRVTVLVGPDVPAVTGRCDGLDSMGRLVVTDRRTTHHIISGQVAKH